ncbi:MAG: ATP synthase F1 subunit delta [Candidatus Ozemobacteraceae bacterium]
MKTGVLARRYAEAFFKVIANDHCEEAYRDFVTFVQTLAKNADLAGIFKHPLIQPERKIALVKKSLQTAETTIVADFIGVLIRRFRFDLLDLIAEEVAVLYRKSRNIIPVQVHTAVPLRPSEREALLKKLSRRLMGAVEIEESVNPALRGGLQLCYEGKVYDASVSTRLKQLKERMSALTMEMLDALDEVPGVGSGSESALKGS